MRKVRPEDEIPLVELAPQEAIARVQGMEYHNLSKETVEAARFLDQYIADRGGKAIDPNELMGLIYATIDMYMKELSIYMICAKGCAECCRIPVPITLVEANYIFSVGGKAFNQVTPETQNILDPDVPLAKDDYCPLLDQDTGLCSQYANRPMACRLMATMDTYVACVNDTAHHFHGLTSNELFSKINSWLEAVSSALGKDLGMVGLSDIRTWFDSEK
ncbi:YkgJ family cysteine cluster protein [Thaumasiovibrio sp. DFM-14]|uniref:YkgJ family cysteine cluster protein n=1 Tax=Thaumasiovibrio sp. DFM-14 TaxID=3384792 RepID=UPI0039A3A352